METEQVKIYQRGNHLWENNNLQIVEVRGQVASFLIVRGSVPIYWSQPGYKYRPPPVIERGVHQVELLYYVVILCR